MAQIDRAYLDQLVEAGYLALQDRVYSSTVHSSAVIGFIDREFTEPAPAPLPPPPTPLKPTLKSALLVVIPKRKSDDNFNRYLLFEDHKDAVEILKAVEAKGFYWELSTIEHFAPGEKPAEFMPQPVLL